MLKALKRKFTKEENEEKALTKRPRSEEVQTADLSRPQKFLGMARRIGRRIKNALSLRTPNLRRAGASKLFTTPYERQAKRYELTPAPLFSASANEWRSSKPYYTYNETIIVSENRHYEFKTGGGNYPINILPEHIRKYGSAFLNSDGGVLLAGILDDGTVKGILCNEHSRRVITASIHREFSLFLPKVEQSFYKINFISVANPPRRYGHQRDYLVDRYVLEVVISPGKATDIYEDCKHKVYIRREGSVEGPLCPLQIKDIVLQKYRRELKMRRDMVIQANPPPDIVIISPETTVVTNRTPPARTITHSPIVYNLSP